MTYRIKQRPRWTITNNRSQLVYYVQRKLFGFLWITIFDKWDSVEEAEDFIKSLRKEY